jgi:hypothetical protein
MQYFLKAGLGPNVDLSKIFVFDPVLYSENIDAANAMKDRYASCFSTQLRRRICFEPGMNTKRKGPRPSGLGTTRDFVN